VGAAPDHRAIADSSRIGLLHAPVGRIAVVAAMRNEQEHVGGFVHDIASQDFDGPVSVIVADGDSTDRSVELLRHEADRAQVALVVLENKERWVSPGLNACIRHSTGDLIVRLDCHTRYPPDYLSRLAMLAEKTGAWSVGGRVHPVGTTTMERAVACATDSPFGGAHWTRHQAGSDPVEVDTVYLGAFRRVVFEQAGLFDEALVRNQDDDLSFRIRLAGGTIVLDPTLVVSYIPRDSLRALFRQYFEYGRWKVALMRKHRRPVSARSLAPVALIVSIATLAALGAFVSPARIALAAFLGLYALALLGFGAVAIRKRGEARGLLPRAAAAMATMHVAFGIGTLTGLARTLRERRIAEEPGYLASLRLDRELARELEATQHQPSP
jgi:succinoglycan biosynthesis protein ExoA